jgi:GAF domain-containing protein
MTRRSRGSGKQAKSHRRKAEMPRGGSAPTGQESEFARLRRERDESLERETATSQVLRLISKSPGDLELVFRSILENATRICEAKFGALILREGDRFRFVAFHNAPPAYVEVRTREPHVRPIAGTALARAIATKQPVQIADVTKHQPSRNDPERRRFAALTGARTLITVPMLKDDEIVGAINIFRQEVRSFTDKQVGLLTNFATQAVIAIENTRLLNELRESLEQQMATSEVLRVISSSPGEIKPVFNAMLENAVRLCEAEFGHLFLFDGKAFHAAALHSASQAYAEVRRRPLVLCELHPDNPVAVMTRTKAVLHTADVRTEKSYIERDPPFSEFVDVSGARALLLVPMLKENELIGAFTIYRLEVRPFTDKQIELVQSFAAQAVIAIENTRLLNELRESL